MIGNDVVDLKQASIDSSKNFRGLRWKRFLNKIFTEEEKQLIINSKNKFNTVWLLWTMKEAAYKIHVQHYRKRIFNPKELKCNIPYGARGKVNMDSHFYYTTSQITEEYIYTIATSKENIKPISKCLRMENSAYIHQNKVGRTEILKRFSEIKNKAITSLEIIKDETGIPNLFLNGQKQEHSFSITHHGEYCGIVFN